MIKRSKSNSNSLTMTLYDEQVEPLITLSSSRVSEISTDAHRRAIPRRLIKFS